MTRLTAADKQEKVRQAVAMSARSMTYTDIAGQLGVSRNAVAKWVKNELAKRAEHRDQDRERAIATYQELKAERWRRLKRLPTDSRANNVVGLLNGINADQERIDRLTGVEAPKRLEVSEAEEYEVVWSDAEDGL